MIQGSVTGPASFIVASSELQLVHAGKCNVMVTFANDTYVVVPAANSDTCTSSLTHSQIWAAVNNLKVNCSKSEEIVLSAKLKYFYV